MKLKEVPRSIYNRLKLRTTPVKELLKRSEGSIPVVVSLTTIPSRFHSVSITVRSLFAQDRRPIKIILWLNERYRDKLPGSLFSLQNELFEIRYSPYDFSHRKLIHSLEAFPDQILISCDDDLIYHPSALRLTYEQHLRTPGVVVGNRCREITYDEEGNLLPYLQWPFVVEARKNKMLLMPVGAFLVLYPSGILHENATNVDLFTKLSPKSDDLWFKLCTLLNDKLSIASTKPPPDPIPLLGTQRFALKHFNNTLDLKREQWEGITDYFNLTFN